MASIFRTCVFGFLICIWSATAVAQVIFADGFEQLQPTEAEAARFLNQAAFGAAPADLQAVRSVGIEAWINAQLLLPATMQRPLLEQFSRTLPLDRVMNRDRIRVWQRQAITGADQLRQRMTYALSQIVVVSDRNDVLITLPILVAEWNDLLQRNAFGNYRELLQEASRSPAMGIWLTHLRNRKAEGTLAPDENYAREIMQLFSIGLFDRNFDFSPVLVEGELRPTYDNNTIATLARVFTGFSYDCTGNQTIPSINVTINRNCGCTGLDCRFNAASLPGLYFNSPPEEAIDTANRVLHPDYYRPMVCYPRYADTGRGTTGGLYNGTTEPTPAKRLLISGTERLVIPEIGAGQTTPPNCHLTGSNINAADRTACLNYCENSLTQVVDMLFNHPNVPPFVAHQLIQRFVTSNPSPAYIRRVACTFAGTSATPAQCPAISNNPRGDLRATLRAVLLDAEARAAPASLPLNAGKPREPFLKLIQIWRTFGAIVPPLADRNFGPDRPEEAYGQAPLRAPTVFNFYEPLFQQPGAISQVNVAGQPVANPEDALRSPEFKIINEVTALSAANDLFSRICRGYDGSDCNGAVDPTPPVGHVYIPPQSLDALPLADDALLVETLVGRLIGPDVSGTINASGNCANGLAAGGVGSGFKGVLYRLVKCRLSAQTPGFGQTVDDRRRKALYLIHMIAISPEFQTQR